MVGENDLDHFDFSQPNWWKKHTWTKQEREDYLERVTSFLMEDKAARETLMTIPIPSPRLCRLVGERIVNMWGWTIEAASSTPSC